MATPSFVRFGGLGLYTETPLHCGAESGAGYVDLPIQRERHTRYPVIPGSTIKGVLRDELRMTLGPELLHDVFGKDDATVPGSVAFLDGLLVAFPVRSSEAPFHWVTCPFALSRSLRAMGRNDSLSQPDEGHAWAASEGDDIALEEIVLRPTRQPSLFDGPASVVEAILSLVPGDDRGLGYIHQILRSRLLVVRDNVFRELTETATEVVTRIKLNSRGTTARLNDNDSGNLFVEELVPADTIFFAPLRAPAAIDGKFLVALRAKQVARFGGDETIGRGVTHVTFVEQGG